VTKVEETGQVMLVHIDRLGKRLLRCGVCRQRNTTYLRGTARPAHRIVHAAPLAPKACAESIGAWRKEATRLAHENSPVRVQDPKFGLGERSQWSAGNITAFMWGYQKNRRHVSKWVLFGKTHLGSRSVWIGEAFGGTCNTEWPSRN
jgi:hypothetical protein